MNKSKIYALLGAALIIASAVLGGCSGEIAASHGSTAVSDSESNTSSILSDFESTAPNSVSESPQISQTSFTSQQSSTASITEQTPQITSRTESDTQSTSGKPVSSRTEPPDTTPLQTVLSETTPSETPPPITDNPKPSAPYILTPVADGTVVYQNDKALIDASNSSDGYIMVKLKNADNAVYKIVVDANSVSVRYTYQLGEGFEVIPITEGSGTYTVYVLKQVSQGKGATLFKQDIEIDTDDAFRPFLSPNQYCMYDASSQCVELSSELCAGRDELGKVAAVYDYVINNISYVSTAENSANGYVPDPERTLRSKGGICFDYASLMAAMLRSQKIPTKVVVGYAGDIYHAWLSVYVENKGWIDGIISFDGSKWNRMDPTFAAGASDNEDYKKLAAYIQDSSNYSDMFYY